MVNNIDLIILFYFNNYILILFKANKIFYIVEIEYIFLNYLKILK